MKIACISLGIHPDTHAAAIRQSTVAKGIVEQNIDVDFYLLSLQEWKTKTLNYFGVRYISLFNNRKENKLLKKLSFLKALIKLKKNLIKDLNDRNLNAIIVYPDDFLINRICFRLAKKYNIKVYHERTELPYTVLSNSLKSKIQYRLYLKYILPKFNGVFVISSKLEKFIKQYNPHTKKILTVVDTVFFDSSDPSPYPFPYIGYCGKMTGNKDGVPVLIDAFARISSKYPEMKLVLIGDNNEHDKLKHIIDKIEHLGVKDRVLFTGLILRKDMPAFLSNAEVLAVAKPNNEQNTGNFPIKVGEYLATGTPVVLTSVGEIPLFVKDQVTGYLSKPDNVDDFAEALDKALADKNKAQKVGLNGKKLANTTFDYKVQVDEIIQYMKSFN